MGFHLKTSDEHGEQRTGTEHAPRTVRRGPLGERRRSTKKNTADNDEYFRENRRRWDMKRTTEREESSGTQVRFSGDSCSRIYEPETSKALRQ